MSKIKKKCKNNAFFLAIIVLLFLVRIIYISEASSNVPIMDYWRYLNGLVEKSYNGGVSYSDLCSVNGIHKSPYQLFLFIINVKIFYWNTQISMYLGAIVLFILGIYVYKATKNLFPENDMLIQIAGAINALVIFSFGAYEIIAQEFALPSAIRISAFVILCQITNKILNRDNIQEFDNYVWLLALYYLLVINLIGGAYSIGLSVAILIVLVFDFAKNIIKKINFNKWNHIILIIGLIIGDCIYMHGLEMNQDGNITGGILDLIKSFGEGLLVVGGVSIFGSYISLKVAYITGIIVILIHAILLFLYIKRKMYEKTYFPACLYAYVCVFYGMIFLGRSGFGIDYLLSSRYITDSSLAIIADIIVIVMLVKEADKRKMMINILSICTATFIVVGIISTDIKEINMAPYRKIYDDNLIEIMLNIDQYADEDLGGFQAQSPQQVRDGIEIMKKYNLGVFRYK